MYGYYFLTAVKRKPKWFKSIYVTIAQISQMFIGVTITVLSYYFYLMDIDDCFIKKQNNLAAFVMYGSYLVLFVQFFVTRYWTNGNAKKKLA